MRVASGDDPFLRCGTLDQKTELSDDALRVRMAMKLGALTWRDDLREKRVEGQSVHLRTYFLGDVDVTQWVRELMDQRLIIEPGLQALMDIWE